MGTGNKTAAAEHFADAAAIGAAATAAPLVQLLLSVVTAGGATAKKSLAIAGAASDAGCKPPATIQLFCAYNDSAIIEIGAL